MKSTPLTFTSSSGLTHFQWLAGFLPLTAFVIFSLSLSAALSYSTFYLIGITLSLALILATGIFTAPSRHDSNGLLAIAVCVFAWRLASHPRLLYFHQGHALHTLRGCLYGVVVLTILLSLLLAKKIGKGMVGPLSLFILVSLAVAHLLVLYASPSPHIDVYELASQGARLLLAGKNPYGRLYPDIYHGVYGYSPFFCYPPATLYAAALGEWVFHDPRFSYWIAALATLVLLNRVARLYKLSSEKRWLFLLLWYSLPISLLQLEQCWVDTLLVTVTALCFVALLERRWILLGVALGAHAAVKQYGLLLDGLLFLWLMLQGEHGAIRRIALGWIASVAVLYGPWIALSPSAIYHDLVSMLFHLPPRGDALSWAAYFANRWRVFLSPALQWSFPLLSVIGTLVFWRRRKGLGDLLLGLVFCHGLFFLFAKQSFLNYYYYLSFFILLWLVDRASPEKLERGGAAGSSGRLRG